MNIVMDILAAVAGIASLICSIIILIEAFRDEIWKGLLCLLCGFYGLYYAVFEFEHENKWPIVLVSLFGGGIAAGILGLQR